MIALLIIACIIILFSLFFADEHLEDILSDIGCGYEWAYIPSMIVLSLTGLVTAGYTIIYICQH